MIEKIINLLSNKFVLSLITLIITLIALKIIKVIFKKHNTRNQIHMNFLKSLLQAVVVLIAVFNIGNNITLFKSFSTTILASSSLLVVVIGFAFQEGLSTIIHGFMISIFHPFDIGDRIRIEEENITGIVENITLRHTVIKNLTTSASIEIPNDIMDKAIIENFHYNENELHTSFLDMSISYEDDIEKAMEIMKTEVIKHPLTIDKRTEEDIANGIELRAVAVVTKTINENFTVCSDIRLNIIKSFREKGISIPYQHNHILGDINVNMKEDVSEDKYEKKNGIWIKK